MIFLDSKQTCMVLKAACMHAIEIKAIRQEFGV